MRTALAALAMIGCTQTNVPTAPGAVVGKWTRAQAKAPGIAAGKPAGTEATRTWTVTTPQNVVLQATVTTGEIDFEANGKPEHAKVPLEIVYTVKQNDLWTIAVEDTSDGPWPLLNGPFDDKVCQPRIVMKRWRRALLRDLDVTESSALEVHGDGRLVAFPDGTGRKAKLE